MSRIFYTTGSQVNFTGVNVKNKKFGAGLAIGIAIGAGIGVAMNNMGVGIAIGVALGFVFEEAFNKKDDQSGSGS